jgi:HK97 family phage major capsid protein
MEPITIEMLEKMDIKSDMDLNIQLNKIAETINAINKESMRVGDFELMKVENAELKSALSVNTVELAALKELKNHNYAVKSADEKLYNLGKIIHAIRNKKYDVIKEMGGSIQTNVASKDDWKAGTWNINAAPDLGTPLRGDAVTGSILIPDEIAREILRIPDDPSSMMGLVRNIPMSVRKITFPRKLVGATWTWVTNEVTAKTETNPTFDDVDLECETAAAWIAFTEEWGEDNMMDQGAYFQELLRESWQTEFDKQCLNSATAPFIGVLQNTGANILNLGAGKTSFASVTFDDLHDLVAKLTTQAKRNGAKFILHTTILDIFKKLKNDDGDYIWEKPAGTTPGTLAGYEYILSDAMPDATDSAVSTAFVAFGNPKHILHGNRVGMEFRIFDQTADTMVYDRLFLRARTRQAFVTGIPDAFAVMKTAAS